MTLLEMMVALFVIGLVLTGLASVLISTVRVAVHNEREAAATALGQQEIERLSSVGWDRIGLYSDEMSAAGPAWSERLNADGTYPAETGDYELVDVVMGDDRESRVPFPEGSFDGEEAVVEFDGTEYRVERYIYWVDRSGDGAPDTKQFDIFLSWSLLGQERTVTVSADRTPSQSESASTPDGARILDYTISPKSVALHPETGVMTSSVQVSVRLNTGIDGGTLIFYSPDGDDGWTRNEISMSGTDFSEDGGFERFTTTLTAGSYPLVNGHTQVLFIGTNIGGVDLEARKPLHGYGGPYDGEPPVPNPDGSSTPPPGGGDDDGGSDENGENGDDDDVDYGNSVEITSVVPSPTQQCVNQGNWRLQGDLTITVQVRGMGPDEGAMVVKYPYRTRSNDNSDTVIGTASAGPVSGNHDSATYSFTLFAGSNRHFKPGTNLQFWAEADRHGDDDGDMMEASSTVRLDAC